MSVLGTGKTRVPLEGEGTAECVCADPETPVEVMSCIPPSALPSSLLISEPPFIVASCSMMASSLACTLANSLISPFSSPRGSAAPLLAASWFCFNSDFYTHYNK